MAASIKDVAQVAGVSVATVSHVINGTKNVSDSTKALVENAVKELDYQPNSVARSLRVSQTNIIGLIIPDISNYFFTSVAKSIEQELSINGYNLLLCNSQENFDIEMKKIAALKAQMISGVIIAPTNRSFDYRNVLPDSKYPIVFIDRKTDILQADTVIVDNYEATFEAISVLIKRNHKRIGFIKGLDGISTTYDRLNGYYMALKTNRVEIDQALVKDGDSTYESGYRIMVEYLDNSDITAVFVSNNLMAVGALHCLRDRNIEVPKQMAIISFDDYSWSVITSPPLSAIKQPTKEIGRVAAKMVIDRINDDTKPYEEKRLKAELIIRASC